MLRPGVVVSIGLDKNTKLIAVFNRFVDFCNETGDDSSRITVKELEFVHCQLLSGNDTAEASALMKNDRILCRKHRGGQREAEEQRRRMQREADKNFFSQIRQLMPDKGASKVADVLLDCKGRVTDGKGRNQQVLRTTVRAHSAVIVKRCPWLGDIIKRARDDDKKKQMAANNVSMEDDVEEDGNQKQSIQRVESVADDDDGIVLSIQPKEKKEDSSSAAEIENDDDEVPFDEQRPKTVEDRASSPVVSSSQQQQPGTEKQLLRVPLPDHSPEAVKLLLEYCYSNRIHALGHEAFVQACKTKPHKHQGPVPPFHGTSSGSSRRWPNAGQPTVPLRVALAGISLAEEANLPRLSLMCEVAAAQLLCSSNVVEALSLCTSQKQISGNDLPRLRKAAMDVVLRSGSRGVENLGRTPGFIKALDERRAEIVPTLLHGTMEAVTTYDKSRKRDRTEFTPPVFDELDREDSYKREKERRKRRHERYEEDPDSHPDPSFDDDMDDYYEPPLLGWAPEPATKRSLKRMAHHLDSMPGRTRRDALRSAVTREQYQAGSRRSNRRRSSRN